MLAAQHHAIAAIEAGMAAREAGPYRLRFLIRGRARRREVVNGFSCQGGYWPLMAWLSDFPAPAGMLSLDEAQRWCRKEIARQRSLGTHGHWSFRPSSISIARERLIVARYFNRHARQIWAREASDIDHDGAEAATDRHGGGANVVPASSAETITTLSA